MPVLIESSNHPRLQELVSLYTDPDGCDSLGDRNAVWDFFLDFFSQKEAFCALWEEYGVCVSALRIQKYMDGVLLTGVETKPAYRGKGYATALLLAVIEVLKLRGYCKVYSHVDRKNIPSQRLHKKCGFYRLRDTARLLDGTVTAKMDTLCCDI